MSIEQQQSWSSFIDVNALTTQSYKQYIVVVVVVASTLDFVRNRRRKMN